MKKLIYLPVLVLLLAACEGNPDPWKPLFNGEDLSDWSVKGTDATFEVGDGLVIGTNQGRQNTFLATDQLYSDFILELEAWIDPRMNSGIQFRSAQNEKGRVFGYQAEIDPSPRAYSGGIYDEARRDWLYPLSLNPAGQKAFKINEWNTYRIEAYGTSIRVWVNGICTAVLEDDVSLEGFIALQVHGVGTKEEEGRQAKWRNVKLLTEDVKSNMKPLPEDINQLNLVTNSLTEHEQKQGWEWLMDPEAMSAQLEKVDDWKDADGILSSTNLTNENSFIAFQNTRDYFEISFQFKLDEECDCFLGYLSKGGSQKNYQLVVPQKYSREDSLFRPGALTGEIAPQNLSYAGMGERYLKGADQWNTGRIIVTKDHAEHWMNGFKIVDYPIEPDTQSEFERVTIDGMSGKVSLRNLKIRSLQ